MSTPKDKSKGWKKRERRKLREKRERQRERRKAKRKAAWEKKQRNGLPKGRHRNSIRGLIDLSTESAIKAARELLGDKKVEALLHYKGDRVGKKIPLNVLDIQ